LRRRSLACGLTPGRDWRSLGAGLEILVLDTDGRITTDYQFIEG